jgi:predicted dehydrogenase
VEINPELRNRIASQYRVDGYASLAEALAAKPELAVIATPAHLHVPIAIELTGAGIHLLIEKPLSTSLDGLNELAAVARDNHCVVGVAYVYRSFPALAEMRTAIVEGRFGKPLEIIGVSGQNFPTYRPAYRETYYASHRTGGGAIQDALTHVINAAEWIVGPIDRLVADAAHQKLAGVEVEDTVHVLTRHGSVLGSFSLNQHQSPNESTLTVICERGTARWEAHRQRWRWMADPDTPWQDVTYEREERDAAFIRQANHFLAAASGQGKPACSLADAEQTLRVNLAMLRSVESGQWEQIRGVHHG